MLSYFDSFFGLKILSALSKDSPSLGGAADKKKERPKLINEACDFLMLPPNSQPDI